VTDRRQLPETPDAGHVIDNPWRSLRAFTTARIGLGRAGVSLPTRHHLAFQLAHAQARDAVHSELDVASMRQELSVYGYDVLPLHSAAENRATYLQRPDLGRRLDNASAQLLEERVSGQRSTYDAAFIIADGLSALAIERHAAPFLGVMLPRLESARWNIAPLTVVEQGRVAISDEIGTLLNAEQAVILIGERPGLSAPDSLGIYLTYAPRIGATDADRNCISNIRDAGLSYLAAADTLFQLMTEARRRKLSGVNLKVETGRRQLPSQYPRPESNFLVDEG
jgi:ethanolamine ammonia-lyase small subunit